MVCVFGRFKSTGVLWRTFVTQVATLSKLCLGGEVLFWGREGPCLPWPSLWGVWAFSLMYLGMGKTWNGWRVPMLDSDFCITVCTLSTWIKLCPTRWAGEGAEVWDLPPAVLGMGAQLGCVGLTLQCSSKESSSLAWGVKGSGKAWLLREKLRELRANTSGQLYRQTLAGIKAACSHRAPQLCLLFENYSRRNSWSSLRLPLLSQEGRKLWFNQVGGSVSEWDSRGLQWEVSQAGGLWMGILFLFLLWGIWNIE